MTKIEICNLALYPIGGNPITSLGEGSNEAKLCNDLYDTTVKIVLSAHKWNFAKKEVSLAESSDYVMLDDRFEYAYQLPSDFMRMSRSEDRGIVFERRGQVLVTNESPFAIEYIASITDEALFPELFAQAVAARLTVPMAQPLVRKGTPKALEFYQIYLVLLEDAKLEDAQDEKPYPADSVGHTDQNDSWIVSRN